MRALVLCCLLACGDNNVAPDALVVDVIDAPVDVMPPAGCSYGELFDSENHTVPEATGLTFANGLSICAQIDTGHHVPTTMSIDSDAFAVRLATETTIRVELEGTGLEQLGSVELAITNSFGDPITTTRFVGAHAVAAARLPAGNYGVLVRAVGSAAVAAVPYRITILLGATCMVTSAPAYTEIGTANDVVEVRFTGDPAMRRMFTSDIDTPELTTLSLDPGSMVRIAGTSANVDASDEFRDRDTYVIATGAATDTLGIRVDWSAASVDLDLLVFVPGVLPEIAAATRVTTTEPETLTLAVQPSESYWIWIGAYDSSTGLPIAYDVSICAD